VNREAELRPPSRVACSDLLGGTVTTLSLGMLNMRIDNQSVVNLEYLRIYSWIEGKEVLLREVEALSNARECIAGLYGVISDICCAALRCICRNRMRFPGFGGGYSFGLLLVAQPIASIPIPNAMENIRRMFCHLTSRTEPRRMWDVNRESGTETANRRWLQ